MDAFKITRSIRQGCPLSAQLYSLVAESLGMMIKKDQRIKSINIENGREGQKIFQYADDTTLIIEDLESIRIAMELMQKFCKATGAKINVEKTAFMRFGEAPAIPACIAFNEKEEIKILGVNLGKDEKSSRDKRWEEIVGEMKRRLVFWKVRDLELKGRVLIVNSLMLSKMWYNLSVTAMPMWVEQRVKGIVLDFLWNNKPPRIAHKTLIGSQEEGGLGLMDVEQRKKSMRVKTVKKYLNREKMEEWKVIMKHFLNKCSNLRIGDDILWMRVKKGMIKGIPDFYKEVLEAWRDFLPHIDFKPQGRETILNQPLFLNAKITTDGTDVFFKKWLDVDIKRVRDILYEYKNGFLPLQFVIDALEEAKEDFNVSTLKKQYDVVKKAIPKEWIEIIESGEKEEEKVEVSFKVGKKEYDFNSCTVKMFYTCFRESVFTKPKVNEFWIEHFPGLDENNIWRNVKWRFLDVKMEALDYFIRHKVVFSEMKLCKIGLTQNALCKVCKKEDEGFLHLFLYCDELKEFFKILKGLINQLREKEDIPNWDELIIMGLNENCTNKEVVNLCISMGKYVIWKRRNIVRNKDCKIDIWGYFKKRIEEYLQLLYVYCKMERKMDVFYKMFSVNVQNVLRNCKIEFPGML